MNKMTSPYKVPLFIAISVIMMMLFLASAAIQIRSVSRITDNIINQEVSGFARQTHNSLQLFFDNLLQKNQLALQSAAANYQLLKSLEEGNQEAILRNLNDLYNSEPNTGMELLFIIGPNKQLKYDASSPFFSDEANIIKLSQTSGSPYQWHLVAMEMANKPQVILFKKEALVSPSNGKLLGYLAGGIVLSGRIAMLNQARNYVDIDSLALKYEQDILAQSATKTSLMSPEHIKEMIADVDSNSPLNQTDLSLKKINQHFISHYPIIIANQVSKLEFVTLVSSTSFDTLNAEYKYQGSFLLIALFTFAIFSSLIVIGIAIRPLMQIIAAARQAINQNSPMQSHDSKIREYAELDSTLSKLIESSSNQKHALAHLNDQLKLNIKELEQSNKELDNITYIASHDLKSPLRGISLLSQWLSHELEGQVSPSVLDKIQTLGQRVNKMESILERMLSYSDVGKKAYELKSVDSRALCHHLFNQAKQHQDNSLILTGEFPVFTTYKTPFEQVLRHLIENAIKHNPSKQAQVTLEVAEQDGYYHFKLSDNGPGMSPLLVSAIDDESEFNEPLDMANIGIGLNMVKKVIKQYDGKLTIILSNDRGTSVLFTWPVRPNALTPL